MSDEYASVTLSISDSVRAVEVGDELVIVDELNATAYALDPIASFVWASLADELALTAIVAELAPAFDAPVEVIAADVEKLARDLSGLGMVRVATQDRNSRPRPDECIADEGDLTDDHLADAPLFDDRYLAALPNY